MLLEAACGLLGAGTAMQLSYLYLEKGARGILTGVQRRALCPPDEVACGHPVDREGVEVRREVRPLKSGGQAFAQLITPAGREPSCILVILHGYCAHGDSYLEVGCDLARRGVAVLLPDLPCHGRTDGMLAYIPDWWAWVDGAWEVVELFLPLAQEKSSGRPLKVFAAGESLGGGLAACMCVQRPTFFAGVVLAAPMLYVSESVRPPKIVEFAFKKILARLMPKWPITPVKNLTQFSFRVLEQGHKWGDCNPMSAEMKPRMATGRELGFTFPDWIDTRLSDFRTPVLICHGESDIVTDPSLSKRLCAEATLTADKTLKLYEGAYHAELLHCLPGLGSVLDFSPEQLETTQRCLGDIAEWLSSRA